MQSYRYVFFVVRQFIPDDETTYDAIQETFVKVYKSIGRLRSPAAYYGWITVIAKNTARDFMRTARFEASLSYKEEDYSAFLKDDETQKDVTLDIESVLKKLDPADADLLSLVYYDGMHIARIAKMQGVPATTVYSRFNKAKRNLKSQLNARGIDKAIYSGNFISMITVAIRNIIGTALLSVAIAQQILDSIINGKGKKELAVAKVIRAQQKKAILKIASVIVAISIVTSAVTALTLIDRTRFKFSGADDYMTSTVTEYYYETASGDDDSSQNSGGGFWQNLFGGGNTSSDGSSNTDSSNYNPYYSNDSSGSSSSSSNIYSSNNSDVNSGAPSYSTPADSTSTNNNDNTDKPAEVINTFGNNPHNVMCPFNLNTYGMVTMQGDWLYYIQAGVRLIKVKTDGSEKQILYEASGYVQIRGLNVIGDTIYYVSGGIWSIKTDGTNQKQISTLSASSLLVRETTGWFVVADHSISIETPPPNISYDLYQIDLLTGETSLLVQNASGLGLKTVIDDDLIYVDGNTVYKKSLSTGSQSEIVNFDSDDYIKGIQNMIVYKSLLYFDFYSTNYSYYFSGTFDLSNNNKEVYKDRFRYIVNGFDYNGFTIFGQGCAWPYDYNFYDINATAVSPINENICYEYGVYSFDDGYAYYYDEQAVALYRCRPDGTGYMVY